MPASSPVIRSEDCVSAAYGDAEWGPAEPGCLSINTVWGEEASRNYIQYCAHYTDITNSYRANLLSADNRSCLINSHVDTSLATAADVIATIAPCLTGYCEGSQACKQQDPFPCSQAALVINGTLLNADSVNSCIDQICASNPVLQANPDIAGIGVIAAYIIQTATVMLVALLLLLLAIWPKIRDGSTAAQIRNLSIDGPQTSASEPRHDAPANFRLYASLYRALVAFLLAQNFLALAIAIAALLTLNSPGALGLLDEVAVGSASGTILLPTAFGLYTLASFYRESHSWYLFSLSLISWILGYCIVLGPQMMQLNELNKQDNIIQVSTQFPQTCGNNAPLRLCELYQPGVHPEYAFYYTLCIPIMLGLTVWQLSSIKPFSGLLDKIWPIRLRQKWRWYLLSILHLGALAFFIGPFYFFFQSISDLLSNQAVSTAWSFGQIVAILATVPAAVEFVHTYMEGKRSPHSRKLAPRFLGKDAHGPSYEQIEFAESSEI